MARDFSDYVLNLTEDDTKAMLRACVSQMDVLDIFQVLASELNAADREELVAQLEDYTTPQEEG